MPPEIADSDAESDLNSPRRPAASPIPENSADALPISTLEHDPLANLEFDQFLSPTQRISSAIEGQDVPSSTDRFLQDIATTDQQSFHSASNRSTQHDPGELHVSTIPRKKLKRTLSDIEQGSSKNKHSQEMRSSSSKKTKTYGSSRSQKSNDSFLSGAHGFYQEAYDSMPVITHEQADFVPGNASDQATAGAHIISRPDLPRNELNQSYGQTMTSIDALSFLQNSVQNASITKSSMGAYQGINMDFRGAGLDLHAGANPFGSLSQVSLDGDVNLMQTEKLASLFHHSQTSQDDDTDIKPLGGSDLVQSSHLKEMATSPLEKPADHEHNRERHSDSDAAIGEIHVDLVSPIAQEKSVVASNRDTMTADTKPIKKKRGRKPRKSTVDAPPDVDAFKQLQEQDPLDIPRENYKPRPSRSRAGTVESTTSHTSRRSQTPDTIMSRNQKKTRSGIVLHAESSSHEHLSNELNLSDPAMIGAPKEMYVPRASKSRSKRVLDDDDEDELQQDHVNIEDTPEDLMVAEIPAKAQEVGPAGTKQKQERKNKTKRAKIATAASSKLSETQTATGDNFVDTDEMPAESKVPLVPDIDSRETETVGTGKNAEDDTTAQTGITEQSPLRAKKITIDIPPPPNPDENTTPVTLETVPQKTEPKKRGRKPKKKPGILNQEEITKPDDDPLVLNQPQTAPTAEASPQPESITGRTALSEKDVNTVPANGSPSHQVPDPMREDEDEVKDLDQLSDLKQSATTTTATTSTSFSSSTSAASTVTSSSAKGPLWSKPRALGLSKRFRIPSLLRKLDRARSPPRVVERKEKLSKRQQEEEDKRKLEAEEAGEVYDERSKWELRGKDGMLLEWDE